VFWLLAFWFSVCFDAGNVYFVRGFAFDVHAYAQLFGLLLVYACFFEFVGAEALTGAFSAVLFGYDCFEVMHLFASFLLVVAVASCVAKLVAWAQFFCASASVVESSDVFACTGHASEYAACMLRFCYPTDVFVRFYSWCIGVDKYNFEPFVFAVFANPVAV
jgi:hypothetical protein